MESSVCESEVTVCSLPLDHDGAVWNAVRQCNADSLVSSAVFRLRNSGQRKKATVLKGDCCLARDISVVREPEETLARMQQDIISELTRKIVLLQL